MKYRPLAWILRPRTWEEFVAQKASAILQKIARMYQSGTAFPSLLLWGPPGTGKSSALDLLIAPLHVRVFEIHPEEQFASRIRALLKQVPPPRLVRIEEIHRLSRAQQTLLLRPLEQGELTILASTTENPAIALHPALLSRMQVVHLEPLPHNALHTLWMRVLQWFEAEFPSCSLQMEEQALEALIEASAGNGRWFLQMIELLIYPHLDLPSQTSLIITKKDVEELLHSQQWTAVQERTEDDRYNLISALIKSIRGSDPDASLYWLARLVEIQEDPLYLARRLVILASEDVGLADPHALPLAVACYHACASTGYPECTLNLAHTVVYLALAPKSHSAYRGIQLARQTVQKYGKLPVPLHLRNAPATWLRTHQGWSEGYRYPHDYPEHYVDQVYLPSKLQGMKFYEPVLLGAEKNMYQLWKERIERARKSQKDHDHHNRRESSPDRTSSTS